jgi:hypothetical protein
MTTRFVDVASEGNDDICDVFLEFPCIDKSNAKGITDVTVEFLGHAVG